MRQVHCHIVCLRGRQLLAILPSIDINIYLCFRGGVLKLPLVFIVDWSGRLGERKGGSAFWVRPGPANRLLSSRLNDCPNHCVLGDSFDSRVVSVDIHGYIGIMEHVCGGRCVRAGRRMAGSSVELPEAQRRRSFGAGAPTNFGGGRRQNAHDRGAQGLHTPVASGPCSTCRSPLQ